MRRDAAALAPSTARKALVRATAIFEGSKGVLESVGKDLLGRIFGGGAPTAEKVDRAVGAEATTEPRIAGIVERLRQAVATVPEGHFVALEDRFEAILGVPLERGEMPAGPAAGQRG